MGAAVAGVLERLVPVEPPRAFTHVPILGENTRAHVDLDPAHGVYNLLEPLEVYDDVVVYGDAGEPFHHRLRLIDAAIEGGVDAILYPGLHLHIKVPRHRKQLDSPRIGSYLDEHDRVGAAGRTLGRAWPPIDTQNEHVERRARGLLRLFGCLVFRLVVRFARRLVLAHGHWLLAAGCDQTLRRVVSRSSGLLRRPRGGTPKRIAL